MLAARAPVDAAAEIHRPAPDGRDHQTPIRNAARRLAPGLGESVLQDIVRIRLVAGLLPGIQEKALAVLIQPTLPTAWLGSGGGIRAHTPEAARRARPACEESFSIPVADSVEVAALGMMMKHTMTNMTRTAAIFCASLCLAWAQPVTASPSGEDVGAFLDGLLDEVDIGKDIGLPNANVPSLKAISKNGKGTITYKGQEVWKGRVTSDLKVIGKVVSGNTTKYAEGTELAAVWDGEKLLWENVKGAAQELEPERRKMGEQAERLKDAMKDLK